MKKTSIEAGGKSAFIVFDDADLEQAAKWAIEGGMGSGLGRDLGESALADYMEEKTVHVNLGLQL